MRHRNHEKFLTNHYQTQEFLVEKTDVEMLVVNVPRFISCVLFIVLNLLLSVMIVHHNTHFDITLHNSPVHNTNKLPSVSIDSIQTRKKDVKEFALSLILINGF